MEETEGVRLPPLQKPGSRDLGQGGKPGEVPKKGESGTEKPFVPSWVMEREDEFGDLDPYIARLARQLHKTPDSILTGDHLRNLYFEVQKKATESGVLEKDADSLLAKMTVKIEELDRQERLPPKVPSEAVQPVYRRRERDDEFEYWELPRGKEEQLSYVRLLLDRVEKSNRDCHDWTITRIVTWLETSLDRMDGSVAQEVRARLTVHDSSELIKQAGGWIARETEKVGPGYTIGSAATEANRRSHALDRRTINLFLKKGLPSLKIPDAWDLIQDANYEYPKFVSSVNQGIEQRLREIMVKKNIEERDVDEIIRKLREQYQIEELKEEDKNFLMRNGIRLEDLPGFYSIDGFELRDDEVSAGKVATNFFTDSNSDRKEAVRRLMIERLGGGENAEKSFQLAEKLTIASLETSVFNRTASFGNDQLSEILGLKGWRYGRRQTGRARGPRIHENFIDGFGSSWLRLQGRKGSGSLEEPFKSEDIDLNKIGEGNWVYYCTVIVTRFHLLRELLLETRPKPESIDKNTLQQAVVYFDTADKPEKGKKCGSKNLRVLWLLGVVDVALANINLEWTGKSFAELAKAAIREELSPKAGTFITREQWDWIKRLTRFDRRIVTTGARKGLEAFIEGFLGGLGAGGKKRR